MIHKKMKEMLREAQRMQDQLQRDLGEMRVSATAGGGVVTATVNGQKDLLELSIDPDAVDPADVEMLQDLVVAAVNEAARRVDEEIQQKLGGIMGGMGLPGMMG
ncbi:MAG: YbaB/EbfC family nucleoid-associated protein [Acidobacteria bacterium]|nr:YbaB/EbfC family nucleoid-associated protein [Acidobacteriota bacterium]